MQLNYLHHPSLLAVPLPVSSAVFVEHTVIFSFLAC